MRRAITALVFACGLLPACSTVPDPQESFGPLRAFVTWTNGCNIAVEPRSSTDGRYYVLEWDVVGGGDEMRIYVKGHGLAEGFHLLTNSKQVKYLPTRFSTSSIKIVRDGDSLLATFNPRAGNMVSWSRDPLDGTVPTKDRPDSAYVYEYMDSGNTAVIHVQFKNLQGEFQVKLKETG